MTYEEYFSKLEILRSIWKSKDAPPSKVKAFEAYEKWDTDMELTVRKPCRDLFNEWLNA